MNSTIKNLTPVASVAAADEFEVQVSGENVSKKCTLAQLTAIEATARALQDDNIEAGAGLNTNGSYPTLTDSWYLRAADFVTGITDRGGAEGNIAQSIMGALRILDAKLYENIVQINQVTKTAVVLVSPAEILSLNAVPKILIPLAMDYVHEVISIVGTWLEPGEPATPYEAGTAKLEVRYSAGGGTIFEFPNAFIEETALSAYRGIATATQKIVKTRNIELYCGTAPTSGTAYMKFYITYRTHEVISF